MDDGSATASGERLSATIEKKKFKEKPENGKGSVDPGSNMSYCRHLLDETRPKRVNKSEG